MKNFYWIIGFVCLHVAIAEEKLETISSCKTPNDDVGYCVPLVWCPHMVKAIATYKIPAITFFENSKCGNFKICCGARTVDYSFNYVIGNSPHVSGEPFLTPEIFNTTVTSYREFVKKNILPPETYCGLQHTDDRVYNETNTALDEFPWLVNFVAKNHNVGNSAPPENVDYYAKCVGVLISNQYVLTSTYCTYRRFLIYAVRLGQHHPQEKKSCIEDPALPECTEDIVEIPVDEVLNVGDTYMVLYKLAKTVIWSDYVRPICLPLDDARRPKIGDAVTTSGFAHEGVKITPKKRVTSKLVNVEESCANLVNETVETEYANKNYAICTKIESSNSYVGSIDVGDKGGPLTYTYKHRWYAVGVINKVYDGYIVAEEITPKVFDWILDTLYYLHNSSS